MPFAIIWASFTGFCELLNRPSQPRMRNRLYAEMPARYRQNTDVFLQRRCSMATPPLIEPQLTGISPLAVGLEGYEEARTPQGIVFYRQGWWCRMR